MHCPHIPVIYVYRDSNLIDNELSFKSEMANNTNLANEKHFSIPELSKNAFIFY
jgi:hypothetical protein